MIQAPKFPELVFDERFHVYRLNGAKIPSVTGIMRPLSNAYYDKIDEAILKKAADRGKAVHAAIENWIKFEIDDCPPEYEGYYQAFKAWWRDKDPQIIDSESRIYHKILRYAGTVDLICVIDEKAVCIDFKTTVSIVPMLTRIQLEAYSKAYDSHGIKFGGKAIVQLQKEGAYKMDDKYEAIDNEAWEIFSGLLILNNYIKKYKGR